MTVEYGMLGGLAKLIMAGTASFIMYRVYMKFIDWMSSGIDRDIMYDLIEVHNLKKIASAKGLDLEKEMIKREYFRKKRKSFRKKLEEQVYNEMFSKEEKKKV